MLLLCPFLPAPITFFFILTLHVGLHYGYSKSASRPCLRKAGGISTCPCFSLPPSASGIASTPAHKQVWVQYSLELSYTSD